MSLAPLATFVLIEPLEETEEKTESGLIVAQKDKDKPVRGKVVAIGPDGFYDDGKPLRCPVKEGETVYYKRWGGEDIRQGTKDYHFAKFTELIGVER